MPKAYDVKRNYYADLELPPTATIDEIKKQYRKLAFTWHPDRNAGKEEECVPKFQAIQAAHEILSDPQQKAAYDADRRVATPYTAPPPTQGQRGNPYQAKSNFPPPPRRTQPGTYQRPPRPQANGADKFTNFAGAQPPPKQPDTASDRVNAFAAWQSMKNQQNKRQQEKDAATAAASAQTRRPHHPTRNDTQYPAEAKSRTNARWQDASNYESEGAESRRSAWEAFNRQQSPGMRRSNTTRTPRKQGFDPNAPGSDERPATGNGYIHRHKSDEFAQATDRPQSATDTPSNKPRRPHIDPTNPTQRQNPDDVPFSEANRVRTPYSSFIGEKTDFGIPRSKSFRDSTQTSPIDARSPLSGPQNPAQSAKVETETESSSDASPTYESPFAQPSSTVRNPEDRPKKIPSPRRRHNGQVPLPTPDAYGSDDQAKTSNIFDLRNGAAPFIPPPMPSGKSRSEEHINTKFAQDFDGTFASQADPSQSRPAARAYSRQNSKGASSRNTPTFGQPSTLGSIYYNTNTVPPAPPMYPASDSAEKFSTEQWAEHFAKNGSWAVPPPPPGLPPRSTHPAYAPVNDDEMDIDEPSPSTGVPTDATNTTTQPDKDASEMPPPPLKPPRMVPVPPSQWQQDQRPYRAAQQQQSEDASLGTNLDDLAHVEPIAKDDNGGLENLQSVAADLPFKSQASRTVPINSTDDQIHGIPTVPKAPTAPSEVTAQSWTHYAAEFARYLGAYQQFNGRFARHFMARQVAMENKIAGGMDWLKAQGDLASASASDGPAGFAAYVTETEEDANLREIWSIGCDRHMVSVKAFEAFREQVRRLAQGAGLSER